MLFSCTWKENRKNPREEIDREYRNPNFVGDLNTSRQDGSTDNNVNPMLIRIKDCKLKKDLTFITTDIAHQKLATLSSYKPLAIGNTR